MTEREQMTPGMSLLHSALAPERDTGPALEWLSERERASHFRVRRIPFGSFDQWSFDPNTDHLVHRSGKFFRVMGLRVRTNFGPVAEWDQPIISQPEIGILGILTQVVDGVRRFLMQAKPEPGNVNGIQLSPTVQATRSNYSQVHQGKRPNYVEYFTDRARGTVLVDQLQTEQGSRFLRKQNRNMLVEATGHVPVLDDFRWLTLAEIKALLAIDDLVNMDARTVLSCLSYADHGLEGYYADRSLEAEDDVEFLGRRLEGFQKDLLVSLLRRKRACHTLDELLSWYADMRCRYDLVTEVLPLSSTRGWLRTEDEIRHESGKYFSVIAVEVQAGAREVTAWTQPLLKHDGVGLAGFLVQKIDGVLHFLVRACVEPGSFDVVDLGPTVASSAGRAKDIAPLPPFYERLAHAQPSEVRYSAIQSEEGGRFYHWRNRYVVVEVPPTETLTFPQNYAWMTFGQILEFTRFGFFNIEARNLIACLGPA